MKRRLHSCIVIFLVFDKFLKQFGEIKKIKSFPFQPIIYGNSFLFFQKFSIITIGYAFGIY